MNQKYIIIAAAFAVGYLAYDTLVSKPVFTTIDGKILEMLNPTEYS